MRRIQALRLAGPCSSPWPKTKPRVTRYKQGLAYERALASALPQAEHGPWFEFWDANGKGHCQPDLVWSRHGQIWVLESKLTWTPDAHAQIEALYKPVLEFIYKVPVYGIVVAKRLTHETPRGAIAQDLPDAMLLAMGSGVTPVLHWLGKAPLMPQPIGSSHARPNAA